MNLRRKLAATAAFDVEMMERRQMLSAVAGLSKSKLASASLQAVAHTDYTRLVRGPKKKNAKPDAGSSLPGGASPAQIRHAYGVDNVLFGSVSGDGSGQTIAIIDAYDDPSFVSSTASNFASSDLHQFDTKFGLPDPSFTKVSQTGTSVYPTVNLGWDGEIALDVEWSHAIAPAAKLILVEAKSASDANLYTAVNWARSQSSVTAISMSWGGGEYSTETTDDRNHFSTPSGHAGISFFASTGDNGTPGGFPAASANVVAVGGTALFFADSSGTWSNEKVWNDTGIAPSSPGATGGGVSTYESKPTYQNLVTTPSATKRTYPDVAMDSDPYNGGVSVLDTSSGGIGSAAQWWVYGGTSLAAPMWAGLDSIINQGRSLAGLSSLDSGTQLLPRLYSLSTNDFHDVTVGNNALAGNSSSYSATTGYDAVTGRGTPKANLLVPDLAGVSIGGSVYLDANGNGTFDSGEAGKSGVTVYIDSNNNGSYDSGEPTTVTNSGGAYSFTDQLGGVTYVVREVVPGGFTAASATSISSAFTWGQAANANFALAAPFATSYAGNAFTIRLDGTGKQEQIFTSAAASTTPAYAAAVGSFSALAFTGSGSGDVLNVDLSNGNPIPSGGVSFAGSGNNSKLVVTGSAGNDAVSVSNQGLVIGAETATFSNVAVVSLNLGNGSDTIADSLTTASLALTGAGTEALNVNAGSLSLDHDAQSDGATLSVNVASGATVAFGSSEHLASLSLNGGSATVSGSGDVLVTKSLSITGGGTLDLGSNALVLDTTSSTALSDVTALIISGRNGGSWNGPGIVTSMAAAKGSIAFSTLGVAAASDALGIAADKTAVWDGQTVSGSAILVRYTYAGDANLDGAVTGDDYFKIDSGFSARATDYASGDFNYDGKINADDYFLIDSNYGKA